MALQVKDLGCSMAEGLIVRQLADDMQAIRTKYTDIAKRHRNAPRVNQSPAQPIPTEIVSESSTLEITGQGRITLGRFGNSSMACLSILKKIMETGL